MTESSKLILKQDLRIKVESIEILPLLVGLVTVIFLGLALVQILTREKFLPPQ